MRVAVIVQARAGSRRLPAKVLADVAGRPMLAWQLERLRLVTGAHDYVVATTWNPADDAVADLARGMGWQVVRGSEQDVLSRYVLAANVVDADVVVRSTADCPLIDPATVDQVIARFAVGDVRHVEVGGLPDGMGCEAVWASDLREISPARDLTTADREHVTLYIRQRPRVYPRAVVDSGYAYDQVADLSQLPRWTVDTQADLEFVRAVVGLLSQMTRPWRIADIVDVLAADPRLSQINADIRLPPLDQGLLEATRRWQVGKQPTDVARARALVDEALAEYHDTASRLGSAEYTPSPSALAFAPAMGDL